MDTHTFLVSSLVVLGTAVVAVLISKRLGLGSVLGYLTAGVVIGPFALRWVQDVDVIRQFSELGVVLLMFIVGLELLPSRLWQMRKSVFGYGTVQVVATGALLAAAGPALGIPWRTSIIAGLGLALSSTAFAVQVLAERNQLATRHGRHAFAVLLFQDLAVIPMLALVSVFAGSTPTAETRPGWVTGLLTLGVLAGLLIAGRYALKPLMRVVAGARSQEVFTATALALVFGVGILVESVGLSMSFGAFVAGVLLADSDYRHELEADIEPFKGLLLGLFFVAVGMSVNLGLLVAAPTQVVGYVLGYVLIKAVTLYVLARLVGHDDERSRLVAAAIAQGGEFAFVLFSQAASVGVMSREIADLLVLVVTLSMAVTPLLLAFNERLLSRWLTRSEAPPDTTLPDQASRVIIAGFGRFGQIVGRVLTVRGISFTALDQDPKHIEFVRQFGGQVYFGDCSRLDLLRAAKVAEAEVFVLAIDDPEASVRTAQLVRQHFPGVRVFARARNRQHAYELLAAGIEAPMRETFAASVEVARDVLIQLGLPQAVSDETIRVFRQHDEQLVQRAVQHRDDFSKLRAIAQVGRQELESLFRQDAR